MLDADPILAIPPPPAAAETACGARLLGRSRQGRPIVGYRFGRGPFHLSLLAGCHADEPVGPAMLDRLTAYLGRRPEASPLLETISWWIVPHVNPDGEERNRTWTTGLFDGDPGDAAVDPGRYLRHAVRELPGDDVEFGFPRDGGDHGARPENRAVAEFLRPGAPFALHASFHGMAFAAGPWFLLEHGWAERTAAMRERLRDRVRELGYRLHDVDRGGEKGFHRIDEGFTSRPDSRAMAAHFEALGDPATAGLFRPSSMEHVRSLGGDPLTLVSEMPLFLVPAELYRGAELVTPPEIGELRAAALGADPGVVEPRARRLGVRPMPIADQMRLQLEYLDAALETVLASSGNPRPGRSED
jgi:hypothetical protein